MRFVVAFIMLAACRPPAQRFAIVVTDVRGGDRALEDAVVVLRCGDRRQALRTDAAGRARIRVQSQATGCTLLAAKPGYRTNQGSGPQRCDSSSACAPVTLQLQPLP
jgi:hypothetical protein